MNFETTAAGLQVRVELTLGGAHLEFAGNRHKLAFFWYPRLGPPSVELYDTESHVSHSLRLLEVVTMNVGHGKAEGLPRDHYYYRLDYDKALSLLGPLERGFQ